MSEKLRLTESQSNAVFSRGGSLLVSAAAGSGKTKVLVERLLNYVINDNRDIDSFLIITYTNAAAAELRGKILDAMNERISEAPGDLRLHRQFAKCYNTKISTIHSFCSDIIKNNAHILGIAPDVKVIDESDGDILKARIVSDLLDERYERIDEGDVFSLLTDTFSAGRNDNRLCELILSVYGKMQMSVFPERWAAEQKKLFLAPDGMDLAETPWGKEIIAFAKRSAVYWAEAMKAAVSDNDYDEKFMTNYGESMLITVDSLNDFIKSPEGKWDEIRKYADISFPAIKRLTGFDSPKAVRTACKKDMEKLAKTFAYTSEALMAEMRSVAPQMCELLDLAAEFGRKYSAEKRRKGVLDFDDQEHLALKVLINENSEPTDEAKAIAAGFTEIMVDEYQDVNRIQETIFNAVSKNGKNIFMVGDVKQSIYRFRQADPSIFIEKYKRLKSFSEAEKGEDRKINLSSNFRSCPGVLAACNHIFKNLMSEEVGEIEYSENEYLYPELPDSPYPEPEMELCILDMKELDESDDDKPEKIQLEAEAVAEKLLEMKNRIMLPDKNGELRAACWEDFAILLRSMKGKAAYYVKSLLKRGIPVSCDLGEDFFKSNEILSMMSLLTIIDNPRQDIPLISAMRSFLFGFTADELAKLRSDFGDGMFYDAVLASAEKSEKVSGFLETLNEFRTLAAEQTADRLLWNIYMKTNAFAVCGAMPDGKTRQNNLTALFELAQKFEADGCRGLFSFVSYLREGAENGTISVNSQKDSAENGVKILSIHKSKGLEYPIVILADTAKKFNTNDAKAALPMHAELGLGPDITDLTRKIRYPSIAKTAVTMRIGHESRSEELRVLYVALTRAKNKLVIFASYPDARKKVEKLSSSLSSPISPYVAEKCSSIAEWILMCALMREECAEALLEEKQYICPGDGYRWAASYIAPGEKSTVFIGSSENSEKADADTTDVSEIRRKLSFIYPCASAELIPSKLTATELKGRFFDDEVGEDAYSTLPAPSVKLIKPDFDMRDKPLTGAEKGSALHLVMQLIDFDKCSSRDGIEAEMLRLKNLRLITQKQADSVDSGVIYDFFSSSVGKAILSSKNVQREFKFSVLVDADRFFDAPCGDKILLQGVIDCFYRDNEGLHIVDYKTDFVTDSTINEKVRLYTGQLETYAMALREILGEDVLSKTLYFFSAKRAVRI